MHVSELWRYPVKSLKGEPLERAEVTLTGIPGDREIAVLSQEGRLFTSRSRPRLLALRAELAAGGAVTINGFGWESPEAVALASEAVGQPAKLVRIPQPDAFDVLPLLIATDGTVQHLGIDRRRLRPNIVIAGVDGLKERDWPGGVIAIGDVRIRAVKLRERCVMTTYDPDTQEQDKSVLLRIVRELDGTAALDCSVIEPGLVRVGDPVQVI